MDLDRHARVALAVVQARGSRRPANVTAWPLTRCSAANAACASHKMRST